jgi:hypothetical protein
VAGFDGGVDQTFVLEYRLSKTTSWNTSYPNWTGLEEDPQYFELSGLSSGSVYDIQMYARNTVGNSLKTNIISVPTTTTTPTPGTTIISVPTTTISVPITTTTTTTKPGTGIFSVPTTGAGGIFYSLIGCCIQLPLFILLFHQTQFAHSMLQYIRWGTINNKF